MSKILALYGWVGREAALRAAKAWPVALAAVFYAVVFGAATLLVAPLGQIGGFVLGFVEAGCIAGYLYLLSRAVQGSKVRLDDLKDGLGAFFWDVVGVLFALWIAQFVVEFVARAAADHSGFVTATFGLAVAVFLNPVPEIIYQGRSPGRSLQLIADSARFVQAHWIEWFAPNLLFGIALLALAFGPSAFNFTTLTLTLPGLFSLQGGYRLAASLLGGAWWTWPLVLGLAHYAMVFRGLLYGELASGGWRVRAFRARTR